MVTAVSQYDTVGWHLVANMILPRGRVGYKLDARKRTSIVTLASTVTQYDTMMWCKMRQHVVTQHDTIETCSSSSVPPFARGRELIIADELARRSQHLCIHCKYTHIEVQTTNDLS